LLFDKEICLKKAIFYKSIIENRERFDFGFKAIHQREQNQKLALYLKHPLFPYYIIGFNLYIRTNFCPIVFFDAFRFAVGPHVCYLPRPPAPCHPQ
jgi:hypothetical protein